MRGKTNYNLWSKESIKSQKRHISLFVAGGASINCLAQTVFGGMSGQIIEKLEMH